MNQQETKPYSGFQNAAVIFAVFLGMSIMYGTQQYFQQKNEPAKPCDCEDDHNHDHDHRSPAKPAPEPEEETDFSIDTGDNVWAVDEDRRLYRVNGVPVTFAVADVVKSKKGTRFHIAYRGTDTKFYFFRLPYHQLIKLGTSRSPIGAPGAEPLPSSTPPPRIGSIGDTAPDPIANGKK